MECTPWYFQLWEADSPQTIYGTMLPDPGHSGTKMHQGAAKLGCGQVARWPAWDLHHAFARQLGASMSPASSTAAFWMGISRVTLELSPGALWINQKNKSTISAGMRRISEESMHQTFTIEGMSVRWNSSLEKISLSSRSQNKLSAVRNNAQDSRCLHLSVSPWVPFSCAPRCKAG